MKKTYALCLSVVMVLMIFPSYAQELRYDNSTNQFSLPNLFLPDSIPKNPNPPSWKYFVEYGDGHYSTESFPHSYHYSEMSNYPARVTLTPQYSFSATKVISNKIENTSTSFIEKKYPVPDNQFVHIETSARNELTPKNEIRIVIHYRMPENAQSNEGYLILFYNNKAEKYQHRLRFEPFIEDTLENSEMLYDAVPSTIYHLKQAFGPESQNAQQTDAVSKLYLNNRVFKCSIQAGEEKRLFLSLLASPALNTKILDKKENLEVHIKAIWMPTSVTYASTAMSTRYPFKMLSVHDPNRLRIIQPRGSAIYHPRKPQKFVYEIQFENKGGRAAEDVQVKMKWPKNLDYNTIKVLERDPDFTLCPNCPPGIDFERYPKSCFYVDTSYINSEDTVIFGFNQIGLMGKREPGLGNKKYTKGFVRFSVSSNDKMVGKQKDKAVIILKGDAPLPTKKRTKKWRHKTINVRIGAATSAEAGDFKLNDNEFKRKFFAGLTYTNAPLYSGFGYRTSLSLAGIGLKGREVNDYLVEQTPILTSETIDIQTLEAHMFLEYRLFNVLATGVGVGPSLPLWAEGVISEKVFYDSAPFLPYQPTEVRENEELFNELYKLSDNETILRSNFGIFDNNNNEGFASKNVVGFVGSVFVEIGFLPSIGIGGRLNHRIYYDVYKDHCLKISNGEIYLRFNLSSIK